MVALSTVFAKEIANYVSKTHSGVGVYRDRSKVVFTIPIRKYLIDADATAKKINNTLAKMQKKAKGNVYIDHYQQHRPPFLKNSVVISVHVLPRHH